MCIRDRICGGTITITYTVDPGDNCERDAVVASQDIQVLPAPHPTIDVPSLPSELTCEEAAAFVAPDASFSNAAIAAECLIAGVTEGVVTNEFDQCGGSITITWTAPTGCNNNSVTEMATIPVTPAAEPTIDIPTLPSELTCEEAAAYVAPDAIYSNGQTGTCAIEGTVAGVKSDNFTICGGTITITYTVESGDNCGRAPVVACLLYTSPSPRDRTRSRMPSSA